MPRKKKTINQAVVPVEPRDIARRMGDEVVPVDAVYHDRQVHPVGAGPWQNEADKIAWTDRATGYPCIIRRSPGGGHLCGYVGVPRSHPLYGFQVRATRGLGIDVHGGIFYAEECQHHESEIRSVCHVPRGGGAAAGTRREKIVFENNAARRGDDAWWLGFECNQTYDVVPRSRAPHRGDQLLDGVTERVYRDEAYVFQECTRFAAQLEAIDAGRPPEESVPTRAGPLGYDPHKSRR